MTQPNKNSSDSSMASLAFLLSGLFALIVIVFIASFFLTGQFGQSASNNLEQNTPRSQAAAKPPKAITVDEGEMFIRTSSPVAEKGKVAFDVNNKGATTHEMVVIKTDKPAADLGSGSRVSEEGSVGEVSDLTAGKSKTLKLKLKSGHYALICNLPGHYTAGMHADLTVK